ECTHRAPRGTFATAAAAHGTADAAAIAGVDRAVRHRRGAWPHACVADGVACGLGDLHRPLRGRIRPRARQARISASQLAVTDRACLACAAIVPCVAAGPLAARGGLAAQRAHGACRRHVQPRHARARSHDAAARHRLRDRADARGHADRCGRDARVRARAPGIRHQQLHRCAVVDGDDHDHHGFGTVAAQRRRARALRAAVAVCVHRVRLCHRDARQLLRRPRCTRGATGRRRCACTTGSADHHVAGRACGHAPAADV
ncbi:MAG: Potassium voltage-gated channel subfamily KQT; possible potassium channel, VIC family, partial [uncultured Lysobacter sp.]